MTKKEIAEIKRNLSPTNDFMSIEKVVNALIWDDGSIKLFQEKNFSNINESEQMLYCQNVKKILSGRSGKNILEYRCKSEQDIKKTGTPFNKLYSLSKNTMENIKEYFEEISKTLRYPFPYLITALICTYTIPSNGGKKRKGEDNENDYLEEFSFAILSMTELDHEENRLIFVNDKNDIASRSLNDITFKKTPFSGFMYPVFNNRCSDVSGILYYISNSIKPSKDLVLDIFGCEMSIPPCEQKNKFTSLLLDTFGKNMNFEFLKDLQGTLAEQVEINHKDEETATTTTDLTVKDFSKILKQCGANKEQLENFTEKYVELFGEEERLSVESIIDEEKFITTTKGIKIDASNYMYKNVKIQTVDGVKCFVIEIDDTVSINGMVLSNL